jgi:hypothetical protein
MIIAISSLLAVAAIVYVLGVRAKDLPAPEPVSPFRHLDEKKAAIYDNLRDLQFEYRVGKLSDSDYQATKRDLQKELAVVMAEVDRLKAALGGAAPVAAAAAAAVAPQPPAAKARTPEKFVCAHCHAEFPQPLKFCGECGKPMGVTGA